jgi:hypothetical protein
MNPQEQPPPGTRCVVAECSNPATLYVDVGEGADLEEESAVAMCDAHAQHWQAGNQ